MYDKQFQEPEIDQATIVDIIANHNVEMLVKEANRFGEALQRAGLTKSQIRAVFGRVRQIQGKWDTQDAATNLRQVLLLKPRLAYQAARELKVRPLAKVLTYAIDTVAKGKTATDQKERFDRFVDMFEAILAYHTAAGGK